MVTQIMMTLNAISNACAALCLAPLAVLPGWLSATLVGVVTGALMLVAFKYTSHQSAIRRVRNQIKANLLALSLFQDSVGVSLRSQGRLLLGAGRLLLLSLVPMLVMIVPTCLLLAQLALWYGARPLQVGEQAVVTMHLAGRDAAELPTVNLAPTAAVEATIGPVRVPKKQMICWSVTAREPGLHRLIFDVDGQTCEKELAVGDGFMPVSVQRPPRAWSQVLLHPRETPFTADSPAQAIELAYPPRQSWTAGSRSWLLYWFAVSMVSAFWLRPVLKVNI